MTRSIGATAVLETAAEIPPAKKSLANEVASVEAISKKKNYVQHDTRTYHSSNATKENDSTDREGILAIGDDSHSHAYEIHDNWRRYTLTHNPVGTAYVDGHRCADIHTKL